MKKPIVCAVLILTGLVSVLLYLFPGKREIDVTLQAVEYRLDDPEYIVGHTVTLRGTDDRNRFGKGDFEGIVSISGLSGFEEEQNIKITFDQYGSHIFFDPFSSQLQWEEKIPGDLIPSWEYDALFWILANETDASKPNSYSFGGTSARFLVNGPPDRDAALKLAAQLTQDTHWESLFE